MTDATTPEPLDTLHAWYLERVKNHLGGKFRSDYSITMELSRFLIDYVRNVPCRSALDLGAGFSTMILRQENLSVTTGEHDANWLQFVRGLLTERDLPTSCLLTMDYFRNWWRHARYDLVVVDHGPRFEDRLQDLPWILRRGGTIVFDDCRLKFGDELRAALDAVHCPYTVHGDDRPFAVATPIVPHDVDEIPAPAGPA